MTALQFTKRRRKLFASQNKAAKAMGVAQSTISYWESGFRPVPGYAVKLLECIEERAKANVKCTCGYNSDSIENITCPVHGID